MPIEKDVLTTGEVAKLCNVAPRTVSKWFDSGSLKGYRIPGSKDRRIPMAELIRFMKSHGIPIEGITSGNTRVLIVDDDSEVLGTLRRVLNEQTSYEVFTAETGFAAGMEAERLKPHVLIIDLHIGDGEGARVAEMIQNNDGLQTTKVIAMSGKLTDGQAQSLRGQGFDGFLKKPFQIRQLVEAIEACTVLV
ncbi:MAG: response regulator [Planctomycetota bacterium]